jgi:hypothetical protein
VETAGLCGRVTSGWLGTVARRWLLPWVTLLCAGWPVSGHAGGELD